MAGATVLRSSRIDKKIDDVDLVLVDSLSLPPHVATVVPRVSRILNKITLEKKETPLIDLSWVAQCIVMRTRVPILERHRLRIDSSLGGKETTLNVIATKVQHFSALTRYEVVSVKFFR